jgi:SAM domain (Sterile alpha motif)
MDVGGWLRRLGLEQYEAAFRENKVDDTVLPSLTAEDLKDLGDLSGIAVSCSTPSLPCEPKRTDQSRYPTLLRQETKPPRTPPSAARSP